MLDLLLCYSSASLLQGRKRQHRSKNGRMQLCLGSSCSQGRIWLCLGTSHSPGLCQGEFCLSLTTKLGDFCSPCHTGSLQLIPKGNQFTWFFVSCSDPRVILPEHFLHARRAGRKHSPVWDHNNVNQSLFITAHHGRQPMGCGPLPCAGTDLSCSQREAKSLHWGYHCATCKGFLG